MQDGDQASHRETYSRYEQLRRIVARYELGELTDDEFRQLKQQVLLGYPPTEHPAVSQIGVLVAVYANAPAIDASLAAVRALPRAIRTRIIDSAIASRLASGSVRVRAIADISKIASTDSISIAGAVCGLLFSADALRAEQQSAALALSFNALTWQPVLQHDLRSAGRSVRSGTAAILIVCWPLASDGLATALQGYDSVQQLTLNDELADAVVSILADARDNPPTTL